MSKVGVFLGGLCCRVVGPSFWYGGVPKMGVLQCKDGLEWKIRKWHGWLRGVSWVLENACPSHYSCFNILSYGTWLRKPLYYLIYTFRNVNTKFSMMARCHLHLTGLPHELQGTHQVKLRKKGFDIEQWAKPWLMSYCCWKQTTYCTFLELMGPVYIYIYISNGNPYEPTLYNGLEPWSQSVFCVHLEIWST